jgi:uncharacterized protein (UPF0332 family)
MEEGERKRTVAAYLTRGHEDIDTARLLFANGKYKVALTRSYYAIFYAASAVLLSEGVKRSKHSGVQSAFRQSFIKAGVIEAEYSDIYGAARDARELSDYELWFMPAEEFTETIIADAERFVARMERYLGELGTTE